MKIEPKSKRVEKENQPFSHCLDLLIHRAKTQSEKTAYIHLLDGEEHQASITYGELDRACRALGAVLAQQGAAGERTLLVYPSSLDYVTAIFGSLYAGATFVPASPPLTPRNPADRFLNRLRTIAGDSRPKFALTSRGIYEYMQPCFDDAPELRDLHWILTDTIETDLADSWVKPHIEPDSLAFLQYTSGSTVSPRGVMVSHRNLLSYQEMQKRAAHHTEDSDLVVWVPFFHDAGLVANLLHTPYLGSTCIFMSPAEFIQKPVRWLRAVSRFKAYTSGGPNFCYDLCRTKISPEVVRTLDLSSWKIAWNSAEPVRCETLEGFIQRFQPAGFQPEAFFPAFGLAEATLMVSGGIFGRPVKIDKARGGRDPGDPGGSNRYFMPSRVASCGRVLEGQRVAIVDPVERVPCADQEIGEIWVSGPNVALGYWDNGPDTEATFAARMADTGEGPFLRTGDLGYLKQGELFVTGRLKDMIVINGQNYFPQDIERAVERSDPSLRPSCGAAFSLETEREERLVVLQEVAKGFREESVNRVTKAIRKSISNEVGIDVETIVLLGPGTIPKTTSGKIQRSLCRRHYLRGDLEEIGGWRRRSKPLHVPEFTEGKPEGDLSTESVDANAAAWIQAFLLSRICERTGLDAPDIDADDPFVDVGIQSIDAAGFLGELSDLLGEELPPTLIYDYPTLKALSLHLASRFKMDRFSGERRGLSGKKHQSGGAASSEPVAVIGMACRFPGAGDPQAFWDLLREGRGAISKAPPGRWRADDPSSPLRRLPGPEELLWGGFVEDVDCFDAPFFGISPREAKSIDPQQRILMEVSWETFEDAGQVPGRLAGSRTGVYIGISNSDYARLQLRGPAGINAYAATGNAASIAANRLSYFYDLQGPSLSIDTACSSSLVAVHQACQSLRQNECDLALAGGVNLLLDPDLSVIFSQAGMIAKDGRCKVFDASADGYVRGEGCGMILLKRLSDARKDGDPIKAVILGSALNQDGRSNGLTAPNGPSQQAVVRQAMENAGILPSRIDYVETHGTGTPLGDPIELNSLTEVLMEGRPRHRACFVGSAKANIGHLESAAGVVSLIKVVLSLQNREIPGQRNLVELNPLIDLAGTPVKIPRETTAWPGEHGNPPVAGVSSFGFGGTNAHLILRGYDPVHKAVGLRREDPAVIGISAKDSTRLKALARKLAGFLEKKREAVVRDDEFCLANIAYSLLAGRQAFRERLSFVASSMDELIEGFVQYCEGGFGSLRLFTGHGRKPDPEHADELQESEFRMLLERGELEKVAKIWAEGREVHWQDLLAGPGKRFLPLPPYPFARNRYWIEPVSDPARERSRSREKEPGERSEPLAGRTAQFLRDALSEELDLPADQIEADRGFDELGIDSILVKYFNMRLEEEFGISPGTSLFECRTLQELTDYFLTNHRPELIRIFDWEGNIAPQREEQGVSISEESQGEFRSKAVVPVPPRMDDEIAIIGVSGRYPQAPDLDAYWENLKNGRDCISEIPWGRWDAAGTDLAGIREALYCKQGGFLEDVDKFDPLFFHISPREAEVMDPQERLFLETVWHTLEDAGYSPRALRKKIDRQGHPDVGVFVGVTTNTYHLLGVNGPVDGSLPLPYSSPWSLANRVSYIFDFQGPSVPVDTACSSGLTAVHFACESIRRGECSLAVAGGVNLYLHPLKFVVLCQMRMLSPLGRCRAFSEAADGFVPGEGVGAVLLKPLRAAVEDGDRIHAVIRGSAINHGGRTNGYTVPNPRSHAGLIKSALRQANVSPETITYVEAHGTGTVLGDPVEISGLTMAFREWTDKKQFCAIGSSKTNIGHLESAAGIAGLTKILLQMKHKKRVPSIHGRNLNTRIDFENSPFVVQQGLEEWDPPERPEEGLTTPCPRRAGISSFGAGGSNAHLILEEFLDPRRETPCEEGVPRLFLLSAKDRERLNIHARQFLAFLERTAGKEGHEKPGRSREEAGCVFLRDLTYTLQVGREGMEERLAMIVSSPRELLEKIRRFVSGKPGAAESWQGSVQECRQKYGCLIEGPDGGEITEILVKSRNLEKIAHLWMAGAEVDWQTLYEPEKPKRIALPLYPFARKRTWFQPPALAYRGTGQGAADDEREDPVSVQKEGSLLPPEETGIAEPSHAVDDQGLLQALMETVASVLKVPEEEIDGNTNLNHLGIDSILALEIQSRVEKDRGVDIPAAKLLEGISLFEIAREFARQATSPDTGGENGKSRSGTEIRGEAETGSYPLSHGQMGLWFLYLNAPDNAAYNIGFSAGILSDLDVSALERSLQTIVDQHPVFRTTFHTREGEPVQELHAARKIRLETIDVSSLDDEAVRNAVTASYERPFDLEHGPPLRAGLFTRAPDDHIFLLTIHHIACDGWSLWILLEELMRHYSAEISGIRAAEAPKRAGYVDYVRWQNTRLQGTDGEAHLRYWLTELSGDLPEIRLPTDRPRPPVYTFSGDAHAFELTRELSRRIVELGRAESATPYMVLLAAFHVLLHRYSGQTDTLIGSPVAGRTSARFRRTVGLFANPVVLRGDSSGNPSFRSFLTRIRHKTLEALRHQDCPFSLLVEKLQPNRDPARAPIFQVDFILQKPQTPEIESLLTNLLAGRATRFGELTVASYPIVEEVGQADLGLEMIELRDSLAGHFKYNTALFDPETIARISRHFTRLLEGIAANPDQRLSDLPVMAAGEEKEALEKSVGAWMDPPEEATVHGFFEEQAASCPERTAVVFEQESLTYAELNKRANQLGRFLHGWGVRADTVVGVLADRSVEMIVGVMGVLKASGAYLAIDPETPDERIVSMLRDSHAPILLTQKRYRGRIRFNGKTCFLDDSGMYSGTGENPDFAARPADLVYAAYTSGSTGEPTGIAVEHGNLVRLAHALRHEYKLEEGPVHLLQVASFSFDVFSGDLVRSLLNGGKMVLCPDGSRIEAKALYELIRKHEITLFESTPGLIVPFMDYVHEHSLDLDPLKLLILGSETCRAKDYRRIVERFGRKIRVINSYGLTETTIDSSCYEDVLSRLPRFGNVPIGKPLPNVACYILDDQANLMPAGVPGEICIGGEGVARGYLNRPQLTRKKFVPDPFRTGKTMYRTGDLAKRLPDGNIQLLGRKDFQVKVRGFRIEPAEVENALLRHPDVSEAVVAAREVREGDLVLCAYYVSPAGTPVEQVRSRLSGELPRYMIPTHFVPLEKIPLTRNGKVDRQALPPPEFCRTAEYVPPRNDVERDLVRIWSEVLHVDRDKIGVNDNFFDLGGHSLLILKLQSRYASVFHQECSIVDIYRNGTIGSMAAFLTRRGAMTDRLSVAPFSPGLLPIRNGNGKPPLFLVHAGEGHVVGYLELAKHLGPEQPVVGIQARGIDGQEKPLGSVEEMAGEYLRLIRKVQERGPYLFAGWSFGGKVAFEMARRTTEQNEEVRFLGLIDTLPLPVPAFEVSVEGVIMQYLEGIGLEIRENEIAPMSPRTRAEYIREKARSAKIVLPDVNEEYWHQLVHVINGLSAAGAAYRFRKYPGRISLFYSQRSLKDFGESIREAWTEILPGTVEIHDVPGDHFSMIREPHVRTLGRSMSRHLGHVS